jgi:Ca2+/Na+ antiporter
MLPYIMVMAISPAWIWQLAAKLGFGFAASLTSADVHQDARRAELPRRPSWIDLLGIIPALVSIVFASIGMVRAATVLGADWNISESIIGTLVLASLTGIPNVVTAIQLALRGRGSAVLSESLNSNTLNLIAGACIPTIILGRLELSSLGAIALWGMIGMTMLALGLSLVRGGLGRKGGALLVMIYCVFCVLVVQWRG